MRRWLHNLGNMLFALVLCLVVAEGLFWLRDEGAYPHVNFYLEDPELGTRLEPLASERIAFGGNPVTRIRTNSLGYRGEEWGAPDPREILILGDSQVFGLGVEEDQTAAAEMSRQLGVPVRNAGVPTYGPGEYLTLARRLVQERHPAAVVVVLNMANDWFELDLPNLKRHRVWDGWAVRAETAPEKVEDFPGRRWLYSQSHLFFSIRKALYQSESRPTASQSESESLTPVPSEGGVAELLGFSEKRRAALEKSRKDWGAQEQALYAKLQEQLAQAHPDEESAMSSLGYLYEQVADPEDKFDPSELQAATGKVQPGDIVYDSYGEGARPVRVTADLLRRGAELRKAIPARLQAWLKAHPDDPYREGVQAALDRLRGHVPLQGTEDVAEGPRPISTFHSWLADLKNACDGTTVMVVVLPLDVQVSPEEWKKYGEPVQDMTASESLLTEVSDDAYSLQIRTLNALNTLRNVEPGAFLLGDIHLTAKGQAALGAAIAKGLQAPPPPAWPGAGLPPGRSRVPLPAEWTESDPLAPGCSLFRRREWVKVECVASPDLGDPTGMVGSALESMTAQESGLYRLVAPLLPGHPLTVEVLGSKSTWRFEVAPQDPLNFKRTNGTAAASPSPTATPTPEGTPPNCTIPLGSAAAFDKGCSSLEGCEAQVACGTGTRTALPLCDPGFANAGAAGWCLQLCSEQTPCARGVCTPWQGSAVCL